MFNSIKKVSLIVLLNSILLTGCQVVSVKQQALNVSIANERDSIISRNKPSEASVNVLTMVGRDAKYCTEQPTECVNSLKKVSQIQDELVYATASELYLAKALALDASSNCKISSLTSYKSKEKQDLAEKNYDQCLDDELAMLDKSIRYSYAYLFKTQRGPQDRIFDNRQVQVRDFYNQAIAKLVQTYSARHQPSDTLQALKIGQSTYKVDYDHAHKMKSKNNEKIEQLISSYNMNFSGLRSITRRDGFGSEFLMVLSGDKKNDLDDKTKYILDPLHYQYPEGSNPNLHPARYLAATITAEPTHHNDSIEELLNQAEFSLKIYNPYRYDSTQIEGKTYPLAANFSAPYGLWLAENNLGRSAYLSLIDRDENLTMPHLYMLEPYNPDKKVIVLVHGLASSPEAWIRLTNDIMGDPVLRDHYQVWQVFYSTNMPILESRFQVNAIIQQAFELVDANDAAYKDAVIIGHSMGGIITRLLVSDANITQKAFNLVKNEKRLTKLKNDPLLKARLEMKPLPYFSRAIFVSAPHRGTAYADRWFTLAARKIIRLPGAFLKAFAETLQGEVNLKDFSKEVGHGLIENGPSDLSKNSNFTKITEDIMPKPGLKFHSIMGNITNSSDPKVITDGIVPYKSAHLEGALSEKILHGGHSIQETPEAVLELRRILRRHLIDLGLYQP
ncbi:MULTISPECIES: alpha/beta hydrolase [unclassified Acinetobacter]|uniref:lipase family alpha/beta hydrolase n=1 Tax=unclassified Acinetobacter TaxID=196816 RepID=UPI002934D9E1|nr:MULTISPECIES: alpha/beta hydrolase [unclassified Acinetobacter]WOE31794.1 alpha/beta hydrolase [Acinetobacter sp. SAAs470]WOE37261.1 alpha/beta hydrolase [Acinetobacter sp. SAAs474]